MAMFYAFSILITGYAIFISILYNLFCFWIQLSLVIPLILMI